jgi:hypothetical protein
MRRLFLLLVALCLWVSAPPPANSDGPVGSITEVKGHAVVKRQGQQLDATPTIPILRNDEIVTDAGGGLTITLVNGSRLTLGESTSIVIDESIVTADQRSKSRIHLLVGQLRSVVAALGGTSGDFKVHTPNAIAAARAALISRSTSSKASRVPNSLPVAVTRPSVSIRELSKSPIQPVPLGHRLSRSPPAIRRTYPAKLRRHRWHRGELKNSGRRDTARKRRRRESRSSVAG